VREPALEPGKGVAWWRRRALWSVVAGGLLLVGAQYGVRNAPLIADWYASFAAENLPASASSFAQLENEAGAFFYCARQVAKRMNGQYSVETFPSQQESDLTPLGEGRYQVESFVDEMREDGSQVRYTFTCNVTYARGRWVLDKLDLTERYATRPGLAPAIATRD
jgi:hypothetical protein